MSKSPDEKSTQSSAVQSGSDDLAGFERAQRSEFRRAWRRFTRYKPGLVALVFIALLIVLALFPGFFAPYDPTEIHSGMRGASPSAEHLIGNDHLGRDLLSRVIFGARTALVVAITATIITSIVGLTIGTVAGYYGSWVDSLLSRIIDAVMAFPLLALVIVLAAILGPSLFNVTLIIGLTFWTTYARVVRADTLSIRERDFVTAARAIGARAPRLIIRHMLPNILGPAIVLASLGIGSIIIFEAALSFLGLGVQPPAASWGRSLSDARPHITRFPHMAIAPGVMITLTVLAFNLVGDGLRDALDPRQRE